MTSRKQRGIHFHAENTILLKAAPAPDFKSTVQKALPTISLTLRTKRNLAAFRERAISVSWGALVLKWAPVLIFLLAFGMRALLLSRISQQEFFGEEESVGVARSLLSSGRFADPFAIPTGPTAHLPPAFPALLAVLLGIFGTGVAGVVARHGLNIAGYSLLYAALPKASEGLRMGRRAGVLGGFAGAVYPLFRSSEVFRGRDEWLAALLLMTLTVQAFRLAEKPHLALASAASYGLGWGALMYIQPSTAAVLPIHLILLLAAHRDTPLATRLKYVGVTGLILLVVVLPWTIRNRLVLGHWMFMRDNLGLELLVSNAAEAQPSQMENQGSGWSYIVHPYCSATAAQRVRELGEVDFNRRALRDATDWIVHNKASFARLTLRRIEYFWMDMPSNPGTFLLRTMVSFISFAGLVLMWRARMVIQTVLLIAIYIFYPLLYYIVQYSNRYVAAISFALLLPTGFALSKIWAALTRDNSSAGLP